MRIRQMLFRGALAVGLAGAAVGVTAGTAQATPSCAGLWSQHNYFFGLSEAYGRIAREQFNIGNIIQAAHYVDDSDHYFGLASNLGEQFRAASCQEP